MLVEVAVDDEELEEVLELLLEVVVVAEVLEDVVLFEVELEVVLEDAVAVVEEEVSVVKVSVVVVEEFVAETVVVVVEKPLHDRGPEMLSHSSAHSEDASCRWHPLSSAQNVKCWHVGTLRHRHWQAKTEGSVVRSSPAILSGS